MPHATPTIDRRLGAALIALALLVATVVPTLVVSATTSGAADMPPFYDVPATLPAGGPGTVIKTEDVHLEGLQGTMQRVMYKSVSITGEDIAVTGLIATPATPPPPGGYKVVDWAHGTTGMADVCAPSLDAASQLGFVNTFLSRGWVVVATDYEGLGTPGLHPYIVGESEARGVVDIVRAARELDSDVSADYLVWGHSQGGHAAMFTLQVADDWAPELNLVGVVAGAPPSQLNLVYDFLVNSPFKYYLLMVAGAINAAYGDTAAPLDEVVNDDGAALMPLLEEGCTGFLGTQTAGLDVSGLLQIQSDGTRNPFANPVWGPLIAAQDPQNFSTPSPHPLLIIHGGSDEQIPTISSQLLADQLCATGQNLERRMYPGQSHAGVIGPSMNGMIDWMSARFAGEPAPDAEPPGDVADLVDSVCVDGEMVVRPVAQTDDGSDPDGPESPRDPDAWPDPVGNDGSPLGGTASAATPVAARPTYAG